MGEYKYHNRHSIRLPGYDYSSPGAYFITICTHDRTETLLGKIVNGSFEENYLSEIVRNCWNDLPNHYSNILLDEFVIMPNHIHGIVIIRDEKSGASLKPAPTTDAVRHGLPEIVRAFKTFSSRRINQTGHPFKWQRNYYEHIIRNEISFYHIRKYIRQNPLNWNSDFEHHIIMEIDDFKMTCFES